MYCPDPTPSYIALAAILIFMTVIVLSSCRKNDMSHDMAIAITEILKQGE